MPRLGMARLLRAQPPTCLARHVARPLRPAVAAPAPAAAPTRLGARRASSHRPPPAVTPAPKPAPTPAVAPGARAPARRSDQTLHFPPNIIIYHAGKGRTAFLAFVRLSSVFVAAFFCFLVAPAYVQADKPPIQTAQVVLAGLLPLALVTVTASPFVTHIHIHLPEAARASRHALERFVRALPPATPLTLTTMSLIGKPRYSDVRVADLRPAAARRSRLGLVNYVRDAAGEEASRRWYNLPAVSRFYVQSKPTDPGAAAAAAAAASGPEGRAVVESWIWHRIAQRAAASSSTTRPPGAGPLGA